MYLSCSVSLEQSGTATRCSGHEKAALQLCRIYRVNKVTVELGRASIYDLLKRRERVHALRSSEQEASISPSWFHASLLTHPI